MKFSGSDSVATICGNDQGRCTHIKKWTQNIKIYRSLRQCGPLEKMAAQAIARHWFWSTRIMYHKLRILARKIVALMAKTLQAWSDTSVAFFCDYRRLHFYLKVSLRLLSKIIRVHCAYCYNFKHYIYMYVHLGHFLISVKQIIKFNTEEAEVLNYRTRLCWHISWRTKLKSNKGNKGVSYKTLKPTKSCS